MLNKLLSRTINVGECMLWTGSVRRGYGQITTRGHAWGQEHRVHRLVLQLIWGRKFTPQELVLHRCDVKLCINPKHLYLGTAKQNTADIYARGKPYNPTGYKHTPEAIENMRNAKIGDKNPFFGRKHTVETKQKMRARLSNAVSR